MAGPLLIVEMPTADTTLPEAAALVRACTEGLGAGRCELSSQSSESPAAVAVVSLRGSDALRALIEVGSRRRESGSWRTQEMRFQPQDARVERFRTLGFAIATLFRESQLEPQPEVRSAPERQRKPRQTSARKGANERAAQPERADEKSSPAEAGQGLRRGSLGYPLGWLSVGALAAHDGELQSAWRIGGQLAIGVAPFEFPVFASLSGSYAVGEIPASAQDLPEVSLSWATLGLGAGGYLPLPADLSVRLAARGVLVDLAAHATDTEGGGRQEHQRWILGGQAGLELVAMTSRRWGLAVGTEVQHLTGGTQILVHDRDVAVVGAFSWQFHVAVELRPFQR